jgi:hypothetical protein
MMIFICDFFYIIDEDRREFRQLVLHLGGAFCFRADDVNIWTNHLQMSSAGDFVQGLPFILGLF